MAAPAKRSRCPKCGQSFTKAGLVQHQKKCGYVAPSVEYKDMFNELLPLLENYNTRINALESQVKTLLASLAAEKGAERGRTISKGSKTRAEAPDPTQFLTLLRTAYRDAPDKVGEMAPVPTLCASLQEHTGWDLPAIHSILYALFLGGKVDLQPGKARKGKPILIDGYSFYWVKPLEEGTQ